MDRGNSAAATSEDWSIVFAAFLCFVFMFAVPTFMVPVLYSPIIDEFGWSRFHVMLFATVKFIGGGAVIGVAFGFLVDRMSLRKIVVFSAVLSGISMNAFLLIGSLVSFYAVGLALGIGAIGITIAMKVLVSRSFHQRQGLALGLAMMGTSVGGAAIRALTPLLLTNFGWRGAMAFMSTGVFFVALPIFLKLVPADEGALENAAVRDDGDLSRVLKTRTFWMLALAVFLIGFVDQSVSQHFVLFLDKSIGVGFEEAAYAAAMASLVAVAGKVGFGWLYDKVSVTGVMMCYLLMGVSVLIAIPVHGTILLTALVITRGLAHGGAIVDIPVLSKHCFGPKLLGRTIGLLTAFVTTGFAVGPPVVGHLYDTYGNYLYAFMLLAVLSIGACAAVLGARPVYWEKFLRAARSPQEAPTGAELTP